MLLKSVLGSRLTPAQVRQSLHYPKALEAHERRVVTATGPIKSPVSIKSSKAMSHVLHQTRKPKQQFGNRPETGTHTTEFSSQVEQKWTPGPMGRADRRLQGRAS